MYIERVPNRNSPPAVLLRESYREEGKVKTRTLSNLSHLPDDAIELLRSFLKGKKFVDVDDNFTIVENGSPAHGHVEAVMLAMRQLGFTKLISSRKSRQRDLVIAMVAARILKPDSKLATTLWWKDTTLPEILDISDSNEDDLYDAMDWLLYSQQQIEKKLAKRHLENNAIALYDLTSSYFEGVTCPLAARGHNRDGKKGKLQVNYGLLTNRSGIPVSVSVFKGNTGDPKTLMPQIEKMRNEFNFNEFVIVGDRGMLTQKQIDQVRDLDGVDWIGALRPEAIKKLVKQGTVQMGLFDERNLFEVVHPDFPGERLIACRNEALANLRSKTRQSLLDATVKELEKVQRKVLRGRLKGKKIIEERVCKILKNYKIGEYYKLNIHDAWFEYSINREEMNSKIAQRYNGDNEAFEKSLKRHEQQIKSINDKLQKIEQKIQRGALYGKDNIGIQVGKVIDKYKVGKHFELNISDNEFNFSINQEKVKMEAVLDGIYIIRTSVSEDKMDADDAVRGYKQLCQAERAFRSFKTVDLMVRPIRHRLEERVKSHIFLCMLAYYVQWHMMEAWRPLIYADEEQELKAHRDPVAPTQRSESAKQKIHTKRLDDGSQVYSFRGLLTHLSSIVQATCRVAEDTPTFKIVTQPNKTQKKAYDLLKKISL